MLGIQQRQAMTCQPLLPWPHQFSLQRFKHHAFFIACHLKAAAGKQLQMDQHN